MFYELGESEQTLFRKQRWGLIFATVGIYNVLNACTALVPVPSTERVGTHSPRLWFRTHLMLCFFFFLLIEAGIVTFTRSATFKENVLVWTAVLKMVQLVVKQVLGRSLPDRLLMTTFAMSEQTIMKTMSLGVATFINFCIQYISQLSSAIFARAVKRFVIKLVMQQ